MSRRRHPGRRIGLSAAVVTATVTAATAIIVAALVLASPGDGGRAAAGTRTLGATDASKRIGVSLILRLNATSGTRPFPRREREPAVAELRADLASVAVRRPVRAPGRRGSRSSGATCARGG